MPATITRLPRPKGAAVADSDRFVGRLSPWLDAPARVPSDIWEVKRIATPPAVNQRLRAASKVMTDLNPGSALPLAA